MKALLRGKIIALSASQKKLERAYTSRLTAHQKALEQTEANTPKRSRWQEIVKLRAEINQKETKRTVEESTKPGAGSLKKINKIDKLLAKLTREHRDSIQINKIINEKGDIKTNTEENFFKKSSYPTTKPVLNKTSKSE